MSGVSKSAVAINLTSQDIRRRLAGTELLASPADIVMPPGSSRWPEPMREQLSGQLTPAGVLVPVFERGNELSILLTQRAAELKHHAGQVSFPGGRMEAHDENVEAAALRETHEEVGIAPHDVAVIGYLSTMPTITGYAVTPVVGLISGDIELAIDRAEVEYAFEVPLHFFLDAANDIRATREIHGREVPMIEFDWDGERIWGATAFMLLELRKILLNK